eukprot:TRINITY_DN4805_c0_g1_i2.p1 TRINITY_DN4805_c0_g1~~TRINITY_DN4805_c0_g1_i2.p1  ORF type:complete len:214 (+),score=76.37 TRINITY_DN4805_c0_g1_i2:40-642(+)
MSKRAMMRPLLLVAAVCVGVAADADDLENTQRRTNLCDACLVASLELSGLVKDGKPDWQYTDVWLEEVKEKAIDKAVLEWTWSQGEAKSFGRFKHISELRENYKDSPEALEMLNKKASGPSKRKDTRRFTYLQTVFSNGEDELEKLLLRRRPPKFSSVARTLCKDSCPEERLQDDKYPSDALLHMLKVEEKYSPDEWATF